MSWENGGVKADTKVLACAHQDARAARAGTRSWGPAGGSGEGGEVKVQTCTCHGPLLRSGEEADVHRSPRQRGHSKNASERGCVAAVSLGGARRGGLGHKHLGTTREQRGTRRGLPHREGDPGAP